MMTYDNLKVGDKLYFIIKSKIRKGRAYDILSTKIKSKEFDEKEGVNYYFVSLNGYNIKLICNGTKGKNAFCTFCNLLSQEKTIEDIFQKLTILRNDIGIDGDFYTTIEDVIDELRNQLYSEIKCTYTKLENLNDELHNTKYYVYNENLILDSIDYETEIKNQENPCSGGVIDCCDSN